MLKSLIFMLTAGVMSSAVALFGDGDPSNGFEDNSELLSEARAVLATAPMSVGIVVCESKQGESVAGSGVLIRKSQRKLGLLTVAHNFYQPGTRNEIENCYFYPRGKKSDQVSLPKQHRIYPNGWLTGVGHSNSDIALVKLPLVSRGVNLERYGAMKFSYLPEHSARHTIADYFRAGMKLELFGLSERHGNIGISRRDCKIVEKRPGDFYYGDDTIYLHSCDFTMGWSGGPLVGSMRNPKNGRLVSVILGIAKAMKIDHDVYPMDPGKYPESDGRPQGLPFHPAAFAGVAINFNNPHFKEIYGQL